MIKETNKKKEHRIIRKWAIAKQKEIFEKSGNKCQECSTDKDLTIHHEEYKKGFQYVKVLCNRCHRNHHELETRKIVLTNFYSEICKENENLTLKEYKQILKDKIDKIPIKVNPDFKIDGF